MKISIVYRDKNGQVEKEQIIARPASKEYVAPNFHENVINTYYQLEQQGKLREMGGREKTAIRDLHRLAQDPRYYGEN